MKILQTPVRFYPYIGGVENYVYFLSKELMKLGHDVEVICANEPKLKVRDEIDGIKVRRLSYIGKIASTNITLKLPYELLKNDFDVIHTHIPTPWSADWSAIISKNKRKPLVLTYHNNLEGISITDYIAKMYNNTILKSTLRRSKIIIVTQTNYLLSPYLKSCGYKIAVIPNGVDVNKFKPFKNDNDGHKVFFLSILNRYHRYKGLDYLLRAFKTVKKEIKDAELIVGGEGELLGYYRKMASILDLKNYVKFVGFISDEKIVQYYNKCGVFVLPSISMEQEGFGIVLLEAMACGKPVVATQVVGTAKDVEERNAGIIVKPKGERALANAIIQILSDKSLAREMGKRGRILVEEEYSWEIVAKTIERIYFDVIRS